MEGVSAWGGGRAVSSRVEVGSGLDGRASGEGRGQKPGGRTTVTGGGGG
jgi:hypothetical protein